jgi:hypothetical protein
MYCLIVLPFFHQHLTNAENLISSWSVTSKPTLVIPNNFVATSHKAMDSSHWQRRRLQWRQVQEPKSRASGTIASVACSSEYVSSHNESKDKFNRMSAVQYTERKKEEVLHLSMLHGMNLKKQGGRLRSTNVTCQITINCRRYSCVCIPGLSPKIGSLDE